MAKIINLKNFKDKRGTLTVIEKEIKFKIKEYTIFIMQLELGGNTDIKNIQALICINGYCEIFVNNNKSKYKIHLKQKKINAFY